MQSVIEFDDDAGAEGEYIAQQHSTGSEAELDVEPDIHEAAVTGGGRSRRRRRWLSRCLPGGRGLHSRLELGSEGRADLNFDGDGGTGFIPGLEADDGVRGPGGSRGRGEMELNFAAGGRGERGGGQARNLAQEFFQGLV